MSTAYEEGKYFGEDHEFSCYALDPRVRHPLLSISLTKTETLQITSLVFTQKSKPSARCLLTIRFGQGSKRYNSDHRSYIQRYRQIISLSSLITVDSFISNSIQIFCHCRSPQPLRFSKKFYLQFKHKIGRVFKSAALAVYLIQFNFKLCGNQLI